jgi:hypothetical protein
MTEKLTNFSKLARFMFCVKGIAFYEPVEVCLNNPMHDLVFRLWHLISTELF